MAASRFQREQQPSANLCVSFITSRTSTPLSAAKGKERETTIMLRTEQSLKEDDKGKSCTLKNHSPTVGAI
jgi:hypothetical protein